MRTHTLRTHAPYKGRKLNWRRRVRVYRNLTAGGYSIMQGGLVVAHADTVHLMGVNFIVREGGRQRTIRDKRKYVHAFAEGVMVGVEPRWPYHIEGVQGRYNPFRSAKFEIVEPDAGWWYPIDAAMGVSLHNRGMTVYGGH